MASKREWSNFQNAIFNEVLTGTGSISVDAKAGAAKTTVVVEATNRMPEGLTVLMMAFNASIAKELKERVPSNIQVATYNAWGNRALKAVLPFSKLDQDKYRKLFRYLVGQQKFVSKFVVADSSEIDAIQLEVSDGSTPKEAAVSVLNEWYMSGVIKLVDLARQFLFAYDSETDWSWLINRYEVQWGSTYATDELGIKMAKEVLAVGNDQAREDGVIDFTDQVYLPILLNCPFAKFEYIVVDEAQDTNKVQREIIRRSLAPSGRLMAVGDPNQAIYGFRGADADSMDLIASEFGCKPLPLSISYRCSKAVIAEAQRIVPTIEAWENAVEGSVQYATIRMGESLKMVRPGDAVLCRNTAPLISLAYSMIRDGKGVRVLGTDIGAGLISLIKTLKVTTVNQLREALDKWLDNEKEQAKKKDQPEREGRAVDKYMSIYAVIEANPTLFRADGIMQAIDRLFNIHGANLITLCTIHKSKGLEWDNVIIYQPSLCPSRYAKQAWQKQQENNLLYVGITRAKVNLYFVEATDSGPSEEGPTTADADYFGGGIDGVAIAQDLVHEAVLNVQGAD